MTKYCVTLHRLEPLNADVVHIHEVPADTPQQAARRARKDQQRRIPGRWHAVKVQETS